jgi:hypothetical protein
VNDNSVTFLIMKNKSILEHTCMYHELDGLEVNTQSEVLVHKPEVSRWDLLLIGDDESELEEV